jgi:hypothetical protein
MAIRVHTIKIDGTTGDTQVYPSARPFYPALKTAFKQMQKNASELRNF